MNTRVVLSQRKHFAAVSVFLSLLLALAAFPLMAAPAAAQVGCHYNVSASVVGGHGSVNPTKQKVEWGHKATINIYPDAGYHIEDITDNGHYEHIFNPYVIRNVHSKHDVYVTFALNKYWVKGQVTGGHGDVSPKWQEAEYGGSAAIDLTPDPGYRAATITDSGTAMPLADPYVIRNVQADHTVVVTFTSAQYTVNASVSGGHGTVDPLTQPVSPGGTAAINIHPATGYEAATVTDNGVAKPTTSPYLITNVNENHTVVVTFSVGEYAVTASAPGGHGTVSPTSQSVAYGDTAAIDITPATGYHTATITDNGASMPITDPYEIPNVGEDHDVVVTFAINQYTVNASVDGGNGTALPGTQAVIYNGTAAITMNPDPGYSVATITDNGVSQTPALSYTINNVALDHEVVVTFKNINYVVAAAVAGGHGDAVPTLQHVASGNPAGITFNADSGFHVATITDNGVSKTPGPSYAIPSVTTDHVVVVTFAQDSYYIAASVDGPGGSVSPFSQSVLLGGNAVVNITSWAGYHIEYIIDNGAFAPVSNPYVISGVSADHNVTVVFDTDEFDVNATVAGGNGTVSPDTQKVEYGQSASIDITPDPGYSIASIVDNSTPVTPADPYVITNVTMTHNVVVSFELDQFAVDASVDGGHGTVSPTTQQVAGGGTAAIDITADSGYHIEAISDNSVLVPIADPYILRDVSTDHDVVVFFELNEYTAKAVVTGGNGAVDPTEQTVYYGDTATIDLFPDYEYHPGAIIDNGKRMAVTNPYFIPGVASDHTVTVAFSYDQSSTFYLAEGSTDHGFSCYISIENPNAQSLNANLTYMLPDGKTKQASVGLPALSQVTVNPAVTLGAADFSTMVQCVQGKTIAVDRTMTWTGPGAPSPEAHSSVGATSPETTWYMPEGCSGFGFETYTLVVNPNNESTDVSIVYMIEGVGPRTINRVIPAHARATYSMVADIGQQNASIEVDSSLPVIAERSMYRNSRREGSDSIGTDIPSTSFYLTEGSTAWGFTTFVLVQNPNTTAANVTLTCMTPTGAVPLKPFTMAPGTRQTVLMNSLIPNTDFSTEVTANVPIIAERAMYWGAGTPLGEACHDSIGLDEPHQTVYLADGQTSDGRETYTLVANPNSTPVQVMVSYLYADGTGASYFIAGIAAHSRATFNMATRLPSGRASIAVTCLTSGKKILAERSMYWNNRGVGTDTVGDWSH
jgi:hypothetical protein